MSSIMGNAIVLAMLCVFAVARPVFLLYNMSQSEHEILISSQGKGAPKMSSIMGNAIVLAMLCVFVGLAIRSMMRKKKHGGCCGCAGCRGCEESCNKKAE